MPIVKPASLPRWGEDIAGVVGPNELEPAAGKKDVGWVSEQPPYQYFNWWWRLVYKWTQYLAQGSFSADAGSALPGVSGTGDGPAPGGAFTPGGGVAPARGALALAPQTAPTAPADGDLWTTAAGIFARIAGVTRTLAALAIAQTWTALQTFSGGIAMGGAKITGLGAPTAASTDAATASYVDTTFPAAGHTWGGTQTFSNPIAGSINGNAGTANSAGNGIVAAGRVNAFQSGGTSVTAYYDPGAAITSVGHTAAGTYSVTVTGMTANAVVHVTAENFASPGTMLSCTPTAGGFVVRTINGANGNDDSISFRFSIVRL